MQLFVFCYEDQYRLYICVSLIFWHVFLISLASYIFYYQVKEQIPILLKPKQQLMGQTSNKVVDTFRISYLWVELILVTQIVISSTYLGMLLSSTSGSTT